MNDLIKLEQVNELTVVDSRLIAIELGIKHKNFFASIKENQSEIEQDFGILLFETEEINGRGQPEKFAYLNEEQATYLMTLSRNTQKVKLLKRRLVKSFSRAKKQLQSNKSPQTYLEALKALVASEEEKQRLSQEKEILQQESERLTEVVDELFGYSSIIRVAKFNNVSETKFSWQKLKRKSQQIGEEIKKAPCPRYGVKNLYSHKAWQSCYPKIKLPQTTTLTRLRRDKFS